MSNAKNKDINKIDYLNKICIFKKIAFKLTLVILKSYIIRYTVYVAYSNILAEKEKKAFKLIENHF